MTHILMAADPDVSEAIEVPDGAGPPARRRQRPNVPSQLRQLHREHRLRLTRSLGIFIGLHVRSLQH